MSAMIARRLAFLAVSCLAVLAIAPVEVKADPGIVFFPSLSVRQETGTLGGNYTGYPFNVRLGYLNLQGLYLGMIYSQMTSSGDSSVNQSLIGNSIGYNSGSFWMIGSYFFTAAHDESTGDVRVERTEGSGTQVDVAYLFNLAPNMQYGPMLTYRAVNFRKSEREGVVRIDQHAETYLYPYFALMYLW